MTIIEFLEARIAEDEELARATTPSPWKWWNLEGVDQGWSDNGPNLESVTDEWEECPHYCTWPTPDSNHRGTPGTPGHEHRVKQQVISSWGHDANGIDIERVDAAFITAHDPARVLAECAAKRRMLSNIPKMSDEYNPIGGTSEFVLRCLCFPYMSHPDYNHDEWAL